MGCPSMQFYPSMHLGRGVVYPCMHLGRGVCGQGSCGEQWVSGQRPLKRSARILLECILVWHNFCRKLHENEKNISLGGSSFQIGHWFVRYGYRKYYNCSDVVVINYCTRQGSRYNNKVE